MRGVCAVARLGVTGGELAAQPIADRNEPGLRLLEQFERRLGFPRIATVPSFFLKPCALLGNERLTGLDVLLRLGEALFESGSVHGRTPSSMSNRQRAKGVLERFERQAPVLVQQ